MSLLLLSAFALAEPVSVLIPAGRVRVMILSDTVAAVAGTTELSPPLPGGRYLVLPGDALPEAGVEALMAPISADSARAAAALVAAKETLAGQLERTTTPMEVTLGEGPAARCRHAVIERVSLTLLTGNLVLTGQRALPDRAATTLGACPAPER